MSETTNKYFSTRPQFLFKYEGEGVHLRSIVICAASSKYRAKYLIEKELQNSGLQQEVNIDKIYKISIKDSALVLWNGDH